MIRNQSFSRRRGSMANRLQRKLWLQNLEDRSVPNTYTVNLLGDGGVADLIDPLKGDIRYCFAQANASPGDDTIQFDSTQFGSAQTITLSTTGQMSYTQNAKLTINGPGTGLLTIAGNATASATNRIFNFSVTGATPTIEIKNLTLANGLLSGANNGGAILNADEVLSISNVVFSGNKTASTGLGGAVAVSSGFSTFTNCSFIGNQTTGTGNGGAIGSSTTGANISIDSCTFTNNASGGAGGAIQGGSTITIIIANSTFSGNTAVTTGGALNLGAGSSTITNTTFTNNKSTTAGGAISLPSTGATAKIQSSSFTGNMATTTGGAINTGSTSATLMLTSDTFTSNTATGAGGAINTASSATVTMNSSTFDKNTSASTGGGLNAASSITLTVDTCTFTNNKATIGGGLRFANISATNITVNYSTVSGNLTTTSGGGGLYTTVGTLKVNYSTFANNAAFAGGGGIVVSGTGSCTITNSTVSGNSAGTNGGGGIRMASGGSTLLVRNSTIVNNTSTGPGGGIVFVPTPTLVQIDSTIVAGNFANSTTPNDLGTTTGAAITVNGSYNLFGAIDTLVTGLSDLVTNQYGDATNPVPAGLFPLGSFGGLTQTHPLQYTSKALDKGTNATLVLPTDQRQLARTSDDLSAPNAVDGTDVGAVEGIAPNPFVVSSSTFSNITMPSDPNPYVFTVTYDDETGINTSSLGSDDIVVSGPQAVGTIMLDGFMVSGKQVTATYKFFAPGGTWDAIDSGAYIVNLAAGKVLDTDGSPNSNIGQTLGKFNVTLVGKLTVDSTADGIDGDYSANKFTLREAIAIANSANGTDTIEFSPLLNNSTITLTGEIAITNGVQIDGPGSTLLSISGASTASATNRIFNINIAATPATVALTGLTLTKGNLNSGNGGAILLVDETVNATDVTFSNNNAAGVGGAIASTGTASITLTNSKMTGNSATSNGGAISMGGSSGNSLTLTNSMFSNNTSGASGGVLIGNSTISLNVVDCTFANNTAVTQGGAFFMGAGTVDIKTSSFTGNKTTSASGVGGAISIATGAVYTISGSMFTGNTSGGSGGAITAAATSVATSLSISNSILNNNTSVTNGGAINMSTTVAGSTLDIKTSTLSGNSGASGGALYVSAATTTITESTLHSNSATAGGGGIGTATTAQVTLTNSTVSGNSAAGTGGGGGIRIGGAGSLTLNLTTITNNSATNATGKGGGVFLNSGSAIFNADGSIIAGNNNKINRDMSASALVNLGGSFNLLGAVDPSVIAVIDFVNTQQGTETTPVTAGLFPLGGYGGPTQTHGLWYNSNSLNKGANPLLIDHDQRNQPRDTMMPNLTDIGSFEGSLTLPFVASVDPIADVVAAGTTPIQVKVVYDDETNINTATLGADDISITGTAKITPITFIGFMQSGKQVTATYQFDAPGGTWEANENGLYNIVVNAGKVFDLDGTPNSVLPGTIGSFRVNLPGPMSIVVDNAIDEDDGDYSANDLSLREAISLTNATAGGVDTITFAPALNGQKITLTKGEMAITDSLLINGPGSSSLTIDANKASRIFNISDGTPTVLAVTIKGLTLTGGSGAGGGAIVMAPENVTLDSVVATLNNSTSLGGVVFFNSNATANLLTITNCTFTSNTSTGNGGCVGTSGGSNTITINNSSFTGNKSNASGGVLDTGGGGGALNVTNSTFTGNSATGGGVVSAGYATYNFTNCTLSGNTATSGVGGAASGYNNHMIFTNCTIANNVASTGGGAISINKAAGANEQVTLISCTVVGNRTTSGNGGGVRINSTSTAAGVFLKVNNSIVSGNGVGASLPGTASDLFRAATSPNNLADVNFSALGTTTGITLSGTSGNNLTPGTALDLGPLQDNGGPTFTMKPNPTSPLIDAGDNVANMLSSDQRGKGRTYDNLSVTNIGDGTDIGAVEVEAAVAPPTVSAIMINGGAVQRSMVTNIKVSFSEAVSFPSGIANAFVVERTGKGSTGAVSFDAMQSGSDVTITFKAGGAVGIDPANSLQDGQYKLTVIATQVMGVGGTLDGDGDMVSEGSPIDDKTAAFHRLFGDGNGDGNVNSDDFALFRGFFGVAGPAFDFDGNGTVNSDDFAEFRKRFGLSMYLP